MQFQLILYEHLTFSLFTNTYREREREEERARYTYIAVVGSIDLCLGDFWSLCCACVVVSHILTILFVQPLHQISVRLKINPTVHTTSKGQSVWVCKATTTNTTLLLLNPEHGSYEKCTCH